MYNVMLLDDVKAFMTHVRRLDIWKRHENFFNLRHLVTDSSEALNILRIEHIDLLITDIKMPGIDGIELLRHVREERLCPVTVLYSESADFGYARQGLILGAFDYLVKPVDENMLDDVLTRAEAYLAEKGGNYPEDELTRKADAAAQCLAECGEGLEARLSELFSECLDSSKAVYGRPALENATTAIYRGITDRFSWIRNIVTSCGTVRRRISNAESDVAAKDILHGWCDEILAAVKFFYPSGMNQLTENIVRYILPRGCSKLTLTEVSDACYINRTHLSHMFKKQMGISFVDYITRYKMLMLRQLLSQTDMKLSQLAEKLGYDDYKYMGRVFKSVYGMTPSEYKRSIK